MKTSNLVAVAWPYANGPLHLGHIAGSILPPDIFARYKRLRGERVLMVSGSDMHGTPITVGAEASGVSPREFAEANHRLHVEALRRLDVHFDLFTSTATENHARTVQDIFLRIHQNGFIEKRVMVSPYDRKARRFLPDRYVEGECPNCHAPDARGDQCDHCGRTLDPQDLLNARSKLSGEPPEYRETEHFFLLLSRLEAPLREWVASQSERGSWRPAVKNFTHNWLTEGLRDRAITRDLSYGVEIPKQLGEYPEKRIYVWFEAVVGYLSAAREWAGATAAWEPFWLERDEPKGYYFLGKDNIPFHTIIWPAILIAANANAPVAERLALPWDVPANEFLRFSGAKFSKSRGNAFYVNDLLAHFDADAVRYYLAAILPERKDTDFTWQDFVSKTNDEFVATIGNYCNRVLTFCQNNFGGVPQSLSGELDAHLVERDAALKATAESSLAECAAMLEAREFRRALRSLVALAQAGNKAIDELAPWSLVKRGERERASAGHFLITHARVMKALAFGLTPFVPATAAALWRQLGETNADPRSLSEGAAGEHDAWPMTLPMVEPGRRLGALRPLVQKLDAAAIAAEFEAEPPAAPAPAVATPTVDIAAFSALDLRVGIVSSVAPHPNAERLWLLEVELGDRTCKVVAALRGEIPEEELLRQRVVVLTNLPPRAIRGERSEGMLLVAGEPGKRALLRPSKDLPAGSKVG